VSVGGAWQGVGLQHAQPFAEESNLLRASVELSPNAEVSVMSVEEEIPIWFAMESACTPPTWCTTIDEIWLEVY